MLWANKHRPTSFDELVGGAKALDHLADNMQHLLLHSKGAGTGKTTLAHVLANTLDYPLHVFNASSKKTRGIAFVEEELIPLTRAGNYKQIILLDEADQLTPEAQSALKGVIENAQGFFILTCNDIRKVSKWLQSRCFTIEFSPIGREPMMERLQHICGAEGVEITESHLGLICDANEGDLRNAINALQAYDAVFRSELNERKERRRTEKFILSLAEHDFDAYTFLKVCFVEKDLLYANIMLSDAYDARSAVRSVFEEGVAGTKAPLSDNKKLQVVDAAITAERDILNGVDEDIVWANFVRMLMV
jgi:DNA polymerase III delta prime subunit